MEKSKLGLYITRILQLIAGAVVLGVGITLARDINHISHETGCYRGTNPDKNHIKCSELVGRYPSSTAYAAFTGAFGLLDAIVGIVGAVVSGLPWVVVVGIDALAVVFYLAGGINSAVLRSGNNQFVDHQGYNIWTRFDTITAFMFIGFLVTLVCVALVFVARRSRSRSSVV